MAKAARMRENVTDMPASMDALKIGAPVAG